MGLITWIAVIAIVLVAIGLGVGVFFSGLIRGAEIVGQNPALQNAGEEVREFVTDRTEVDGRDVLVITTGEATYALEVAGESMLPLYRDGDIVIVSPTATCRKGDRVVVRTRDGEVMAKILEKKNTRSVELRSLNPDHRNRVFPVGDIDWMARIIWASQ